ncbi:uncharacterized protein [Procambarus clarkii]|uniref:uncharacterized protein isoform X2 n=1 Tax=Procambarus clarkii TaxID=6728 RepID=UPI001E6725D3|nr:uncharacterized protein LOC123771681 isoform X2 [Procambarus clarkii]
MRVSCLAASSSTWLSSRFLAAWPPIPGGAPPPIAIPGPPVTATCPQDTCESSSRLATHLIDKDGYNGVSAVTRKKLHSRCGGGDGSSGGVICSRMEEEGSVQFIQQKNNIPTCCTFHPKDRYAFAFGGSEGEITVVNALRGEIVRSVPLGSLSLARAINALNFSPDGSKAITTSVSRKVNIVDIEKGTPLLAYDNCASPVDVRQPLIVHPSLPYLAACTTVNARGITLLDLRMPLPLDFIYDLHEDSINDMCFLDGSWPWGSGKAVLVSGSALGEVKVNSMDGRSLCSFTEQPPISCLYPSPEGYNASVANGYPSVMMASTGEGLVCWCVGERPWKWETQKVNPGRVARMRYTLSGGVLYTAQGKTVYRYRRYPERHQVVGQVFTHTAPILDLDLSPYNEYLITAGKDNMVGLLHLGAPNHGWTQRCEFT